MRARPTCTTIVAVCCALVAACGESPPLEWGGVRVAERQGRVALVNDRLTITFDLTSGTWAVAQAGGRVVLEGAAARVRFRRGDQQQTVGSAGPATRSWRAERLADRLGEGLRLTIDRAPQGELPGFETTIDLRQEASYITTASTVYWEGAEGPLPRIERLSPLVADEETNGALFVGADPATHRALDNGTDIYFDYEASVALVGLKNSLLFGPGGASNWNLALHEPSSGQSLVAGFLSVHRAAGLVAYDYVPAKARDEDGRRSFTRFEALGEYLGGRQAMVDQGRTYLDSELFYLDGAPPNVFEALESYARRFARRIGKQVRRQVPASWNSWGGGGGSGGYGTTIDEQLMLENLDAAARDFAPWGMQHFVVDDGWEDAEGDWNGHPERFPPRYGRDGMWWFAREVAGRGMIPGLWISAFGVEPESQLAQQHPDWFAQRSAIGLASVPDDIKVLDLSHPAVRDWVGGTFYRLTHRWGYRLIKLDFSYYALMTDALHDPAVTPIEAYTGAMELIRQVIGEQTFFMVVGVTGPTFAYADASRITLDNQPQWGPDQGSGVQGVKPTYRTLARRYYLNHALWINHPDLLFFRDDFALTLTEARVWNSVVAITGGLVKLGESFVAMQEHPEWLALVQPMLPVYPRTGRPLDLFLRVYPERWVLSVERKEKRWHVVGLFNWGTNRDIGQADWEPEQDRLLAVELAALGLDPAEEHLVFSVWDRSWRWSHADRIEATVAPRDVALLIVRPRPAEPTVVFTTRHLMGGAVEVQREQWAAETATLSLQLSTVPGAALTVYLADGGRTLIDAQAPGAETPQHDSRDGLVLVSLTPRAGTTTLSLRFSR